MNNEGNKMNDSCGFQIFRLEETEKNDGLFKTASRRLAYFEFLWIPKGEGILSVDTHQFSLSGPNFYILSPGQCRKLHALGNIQGYCIRISPGFLTACRGSADHAFFESGYYADICYAISITDADRIGELQDIIEGMRKEYHRYQLLRPEILGSHVRILACHLAYCFNPRRMSFCPDRENEIVRTFLSLVKRDVTSRKTVAEYAEEMYLSANHLNQVVKKLSGQTASYHIHRSLIEEIKRRMLTAPSSMKEIAYAFGFEDCSHFSKYFKNKCGVNFSRFKREGFNPLAA